LQKRVKLPLVNLNQHITCKLCNGYLVDAATITECLHTFCKSCLVRHIELVNRCPTCNTVIHETQPLYNIRGCSPGRPAAVISTTGHKNHCLLITCGFAMIAKCLS
ncbi:unnamed protein product, partial [Porites evermanni]